MLGNNVPPTRINDAIIFTKEQWIKARQFLGIRLFIVLIAGLVAMGSVYAGETKDVVYQKSEEHLRERVEKYFKYCAEKEYAKIEAEILSSRKRYALDYYKRYGLNEEWKYNGIEAIKMIGDRAYVYLEILGKWRRTEDYKSERYTQEWLFENNEWYLRDLWMLEGQSCKGQPVVFLNIQTKKLGLKTVKISWETDEEVESKITYSTWGGVSGRPIEKTLRLSGLKKKHEAVLTDLRFSEKYDFDITAIKDKKECNSNVQYFMTGGLAELEFSKIWLKLISLGKTGEEIFLKVKEDAEKGAGSTFLEVDAAVAQKIANEGGYVFSDGLDKSGKDSGGIVAPELPEIKKEAREKSKGCKGTLIIMVGPALSLYAECLYDYSKMIPKYYASRATLSEIAKKNGLSIEKEEDVIEWLRKTDHKIRK
ncbi:MAG: hypothetical protein MUP30_07625 [Deltaproteobacteria bacterium]|nr:hypothetical protein [Deltaproteobacteria bacterium]